MDQGRLIRHCTKLAEKITEPGGELDVDNSCFKLRKSKADSKTFLETPKVRRSWSRWPAAAYAHAVLPRRRRAEKLSPSQTPSSHTTGNQREQHANPPRHVRATCANAAFKEPIPPSSQQPAGGFRAIRTP